MAWKDLISAARAYNFEFPKLKAICLAQWALESGRGTSVLSEKFKNYGGLKYRDELARVRGVSKIFYDEGRGEADKYYFQCASEEAFIRLYWAFIARAPYVGWQEAAKLGPIEYIKFIANSGYIGGPSSPQSMKDEYVAKISSLLPEMEMELARNEGESDMPSNQKYSLKGIKVVFDCGHGYDADLGDTFDPGAMGNGAKEQTEAIIYATRAAEILRGSGAEVSVFHYSNKNEKRFGLRAKGARGAGANLFISCHLNSFNGAVQGTETLVENAGTSEDVALATQIQNALVAKLEFADRGIKRQGLGVLAGVPTTVKAAVLCEPFFIDAGSVGGADNVRALAIKVGDAVAAGIIAYCKIKGMGQVVSEPVPEPIPAPVPVPVPEPKPPEEPKESKLKNVYVKLMELWQSIVDLFRSEK